jgi:hypothetical protein
MAERESRLPPMLIMPLESFTSYGGFCLYMEDRLEFELLILLLSSFIRILYSPSLNFSLASSMASVDRFYS